MAKHRISCERIAAAFEVIDPLFLHSPQFEAETLSALFGCHVVVKVETINPIRSFKGRGADYLAAAADPQVPLVCASAGNFGQGLAFAARKRGLMLTVFAAETANPTKIERMRALGAEVRLVGHDFDTAKQAARVFANETGRRFVEDSRDLETAEGAGTMAVELLRWPQPFDAVLIALGNGAMLAGMAHWIKTYAPTTQVFGVCATGAPAMERSWRSGQLITTESVATIADGIAVRIPVPEALADLDGVVDDILLVDDQVLRQGIDLARRHLGIILEPSGAAGLAALLANPGRFAGQTVATVLCGGHLIEAA